MRDDQTIHPYLLRVQHTKNVMNARKKTSETEGSRRASCLFQTSTHSRRVSHAACKNEFRLNSRSHRRGVYFMFMNHRNIKVKLRKYSTRHYVCMCACIHTLTPGAFPQGRSFKLACVLKNRCWGSATIFSGVQPVAYRPKGQEDSHARRCLAARVQFLLLLLFSLLLSLLYMISH